MNIPSGFPETGTRFFVGNITFTDATTSTNNLAITSNILTLDRTAGVPVIDVTQADRSLSISSVVAGNDGLQKDGAGNLTLFAVNTYTGATTINQGALKIGSGGSLGNTGTYAGAISITSGAALELNGTN